MRKKSITDFLASSNIILVYAIFQLILIVLEIGNDNSSGCYDCKFIITIMTYFIVKSIENILIKVVVTGNNNTVYLEKDTNE